VILLPNNHTNSNLVSSVLLVTMAYLEGDKFDASSLLFEKLKWLMLHGLSPSQQQDLSIEEGLKRWSHLA
jgi:hypothetical protein